MPSGLPPPPPFPPLQDLEAAGIQDVRMLDEHVFDKFGLIRPEAKGRALEAAQMSSSAAILREVSG